ncbi:MAG: hypothetical protein ACRDRL_24470 [Sciscionella sp.]
MRRPIPAKAIYWPASKGYGDDYLTCDSTAFPELASIKARANSISPAPLGVFVKAVSEAQDRVLIIDDYLFNQGEGDQQQRIKQILDWFPETFSAKDVRMLIASTGTRESDLQISSKLFEYASMINDLKVHPDWIQITVKFTLMTHFPYVHDRFAIVDDELWHFGATVGGLHSKLNAASRGWPADEHRALAFFEAAWRGDAQVAKRHHS